MVAGTVTDDPNRGKHHSDGRVDINPVFANRDPFFSVSSELLVAASQTWLRSEEISQLAALYYGISKLPHPIAHLGGKSRKMHFVDGPPTMWLTLTEDETKQATSILDDG